MGVLALSTKERRRLELLSHVKGGGLRLRKVAELLKLSYRQAKRLWKRYRDLGDAGLVHGNRGRRSNRSCEVKHRDRILRRYEEVYSGFGPTLAAEYLRKEGMAVDHETLRRWLMEKGLWQKQRKRQTHRQWRERRAHQGELIQMDGSHHDWFEGRRDWAVLMVMIDDATNRTYVRFYESEDTCAAMDVTGRYIRRYGCPHYLYVDRDSIYECTRDARVDEQLRGEGPQTQFDRAMKQLGIEILLANSPQAKGRVERRNGVLQDRLVKAMRLEKISTLEEANRFLEKVFLPDLNRRFRVAAREREDLHRPVPRGLQLYEVLSLEEPRVVQNDWTVRWCNRRFQISAYHERLNLAGRTLIVRERLDGSMALVYRGERLRFCEIPLSKSSNPTKRAPKTPVKWKPPEDHPWKRYRAAARPIRPPSSDEPNRAHSRRGPMRPGPRQEP
ncbi:MAG: ISNCY family transposase [Kiritimatiellae bacterium]|nr:ISNCY family transposase [Kiritimatiellia bacterium]